MEPSGAGKPWQADAPPPPAGAELWVEWRGHRLVTLPHLVLLAVPAISGPGNLCFPTPAFPDREEGLAPKDATVSSEVRICKGEAGTA